MRQPTDVCGIESDMHDDDLKRCVLSLQPGHADGTCGFIFTQPIWEEEVTLCGIHRIATEGDPQAEPPIPDNGTKVVALPEGVPIRLVWAGEIIPD